MTNPLLAIAIGAIVGALAVWVTAFSGFAIEGWMAALVVTSVAVAGGVSSTGLPTGHDVKRKPAGTTGP